MAEIEVIEEVFALGEEVIEVAEVAEEAAKVEVIVEAEAIAGDLSTAQKATLWLKNNGFKLFVFGTTTYFVVNQIRKDATKVKAGGNLIKLSDALAKLERASKDNYPKLVASAKKIHDDPVLWPLYSGEEKKQILLEIKLAFDEMWAQTLPGLMDTMSSLVIYNAAE